MRYSLRDRFFLLKKDFFTTLSAHKGGVFSGLALLLLGVAVGIYIGSDVGEMEPPFCIFASLFCLKFSPFSFLMPDFLRFLLFSLLSALSFFLPLPMLYPAIAIFFFGKYFGELACVCFFSDPIIPAILSILLVYLPLLVIGGSMLLSIAIKARSSRIKSGVDPCRKSVKGELLYVLTLLAAYFVLLFAIYVLLCGAIYLILIAL